MKLDEILNHTWPAFSYPDDRENPYWHKVPPHVLKEAKIYLLLLGATVDHEGDLLLGDEYVVIHRETHCDDDNVEANEYELNIPRIKEYMEKHDAL